MNSRRTVLTGLAACALAYTASSAVVAQSEFNRPRPKPSEAEWLALAKLPDFTGVWELGFGGGAAAGGARGDTAGRRGAAPPDGAARGAGVRGEAAGGRGAGGAGRGGGRGRGGPAYTPEYQAKARPNIGEELSSRCIPPGLPSSMSQPYPIEFILSPGKVTMILEAYQQIRHIYTDGRPLPADPEERFQGTSIGRWEGDTLVVETVGFSPHTYLPGGVPHSSRMKVVERMRLTGPDTMTIEMMITDPEAVQAPIVSNLTLQRHRTWTLAEYICEENNRNLLDDSGKPITVLENPGGLPPVKP